jgi:type VI protein secretion system component VasK
MVKKTSLTLLKINIGIGILGMVVEIGLEQLFSLAASGITFLIALIYLLWLLLSYRPYSKRTTQPRRQSSKKDTKNARVRTQKESTSIQSREGKYYGSRRHRHTHR